jgi:NADPH:quinone reductase-like Zn-dependent oxidoreductase
VIGRIGSGREGFGKFENIMKAARIHKFGGPEVIVTEDVPVPVPASGEVLVRVGAAGVGPWDALIREGQAR